MHQPLVCLSRRSVCVRRLLALSAVLATMSLSGFTLAQVPASPVPAPSAPTGNTPEATTPDVLLFTNGDQLTGHLVRAVGSTIVFHSDMAGDITVPDTKIKELRSSGSFALLRKNEQLIGVAVQPGSIHLENNQVVLSTNSGPIATVPVQSVGYIVDAATFRRETDPHPSIWYGWSGTLTAGATLVRSTQTGTTLTGGAALVRQFPTVDYLPKRNRTTLDLSETYGTSRSPGAIPQPPSPTPPVPDSVVKTNIFHFDAEQDKYLSRRSYLLGDASLDHNFSLGLQLQQIYGLGFGWTPISNPRQQLDLKADAHFERQSFFTTPSSTAVAYPNQNLFGSTFGEDYKRNFARGIVFSESGNVIPSWTYLNAYSANITAGLALPIWKRFSANLSTTDNFINNPSPGYKKNSFQFVTGLSYSLK